MRAAERDGKFITRFATQRPRLHKSDVMRIRWFAPAQQAGLLHHKAEVVPVAVAPRRRYREHALIDSALISAAFIDLAKIVTTSAETFRSIDIHDLSTFGRQELD